MSTEQDNKVRYLPRERNPSEVQKDSVLHWRIYYRDGRMISSKDCAWQEAHSTEIVAVVHALNDEKPAVEFGTPYYWHQEDWIARIWDPTLYLRQTGLVKFGRWTTHQKFNEAWRETLKTIANGHEDAQRITEGAIQSGCVFTTKTVDAEERGQTWKLFYDDKRLFSSEQTPWDQAPSDGVLSAIYTTVYSGLKLQCAMRRYTYYFWRGTEMVNTDDLDEVLKEFPECKYGQPSFVGKSYRHQAIAIAEALKDDLADIR